MQFNLKEIASLDAAKEFAVFWRRHFRRFVPLVLLGLFLPLSAIAADKKKPAPPPVIDKLLWLAGDWRVEKNSRVIDEQWMIPGGGAMLGMRRTVMKGRELDHAFLQIREGPGGALFYVMQPSGAKEATFQLSSLTETAVVFENQLQDFPRKITLALQSEGSLLVTIEGTGSDGEVKKSDDLYQRFNR